MTRCFPLDPHTHRRNSDIFSELGGTLGSIFTMTPLRFCDNTLSKISDFFFETLPYLHRIKFLIQTNSITQWTKTVYKWNIHENNMNYDLPPLFLLLTWFSLRLCFLRNQSVLKDLPLNIREGFKKKIANFVSLKSHYVNRFHIY